MNTNQQLTRRTFLGWSTAAAVAGPNILPSAAHGANDRINLGVIGLGGRGRTVMNAFMQEETARVIAVCDVFRDRRSQGEKMVNDTYGTKDCATYQDALELLGREDIDAVLIATGDNWHSAMAMEAARAGKDMYCEKPMSVTIAESRAVSDTMKRLGRVFQCGTQRRSISHFEYAANLARTGKLGKITELHAEEAGAFQKLNYEILPGEEAPSDEIFDWNRWLGPAQWRPYNAQYPTRGYWSGHVDFSGGSITEWGSHTVDICQWANDSDDTGPVEFWNEGDRYIGRYDNGAKLIIRRGLRFGSCPVRIVGEEGWVETGDSGMIETYPKTLLAGRVFEGGYPPDNHVRAFLNNVRTREEPISNAEVAHRSITACHVANICKRLGRPVKWDPKTETCVDNEEANRLCSRAFREPWYA